MMTSEQLAALTSRWEQANGPVETIPLHRRDIPPLEAEAPRKPNPLTPERIKARDFLLSAPKGLMTKDVVKAIGVSATVIREEAKNTGYHLCRPSTKPRSSLMREQVIGSFHDGVTHPIAAERAGCTAEYARRIYKELGPK